MHRVIWVLVVLHSASEVGAQSQYKWTYFGPAYGMGMSFNKMLQDQKGFLWLGSTNGLYRYDGYDFTFFKKYTARPTGLSSHRRQGAIYRLHASTLRSDRLFSTSGSGDAAPLSLWQPAGNSKELRFSSTRLHRLQLDTEDHQSYELKISSSVPAQTSLRSRMQTINAGQKSNLWITPLGMSPTIQIRGSDNYFFISGIEHFNTAGNTSRYFSRIFTQTYGKPPSAMR